ncbi:hypothetical protein [Hymenobacter yonginensis]|uniref:Histone H1 n=1 Tax=Hymenobacter yonginensis TaxID=748197 RepID=A0ABY7PU07_9BACT|nr:hypothetical protein [Hymenobacter yonginensis]WBO86397.1 hypothetical protein O9Z63_09070 [Hymenobacter yonginensis]
MATPDLNKLQQILQNAEANDQRLNAIKKAYSKVEAAMNEFSALLSDDYQPIKKERKPRDPNAKKPGRPRKPTAE